jgi:cell division protein FtsB
VTTDPTARALRAVQALAADLAAERRESAALRRRVAELQAEVDRLNAGAGPARPLDARLVPGSRPEAPVAGRT